MGSSKGKTENIKTQKKLEQILKMVLQPWQQKLKPLANSPFLPDIQCLKYSARTAENKNKH